MGLNQFRELVGLRSRGVARHDVVVRRVGEPSLRIAAAATGNRHAGQASFVGDGLDSGQSFLVAVARIEDDHQRFAAYGQVLRVFQVRQPPLGGLLPFVGVSEQEPGVVGHQQAEF